MQKVAQNVYVETNICNHSFVKTSEGLVAIDTPTVPEASVAWQKEIAKHGTVRYLIDTEGHYDHFAGNYFFDALIVGHEGARRDILASSMEELKQMIAGMAPGSSLCPTASICGLPRSLSAVSLPCTWVIAPSGLSTRPATRLLRRRYTSPRKERSSLGTTSSAGACPSFTRPCPWSGSNP